METIARRSGESVYIGENIRVAVVLEDGNITLGIQAPDSMPVVKGEHFSAPSSLIQRFKTLFSFRAQRSA